MKFRFVPKRTRIEINEEDPAEWIDNDLDSDGVDLEEWGFMQGYYGAM